MIDLKNDPMVVVNKYYLDRLEFILDQMGYETMLCEPNSYGVVIELDFVGTKDEVAKKLEALIAYRKTDPYATENDRLRIIHQLNRFNDYRKYVAANPFKKKINALFKALFNPDEKTDSEQIKQDIEKCKEFIKKNQMQKHNKKECVCFS